MRRYFPYIFINLVFALDSILLNYAEIQMPVTLTDAEYIEKVMLFAASISLISWIPYLLLFIFSRPRWRGLFEFDFWDRSLILLCLFFAALDSLDYLVNDNFRPTWLDWRVFIFMNLVILTGKIYFARRNGKKESL